MASNVGVLGSPKLSQRAAQIVVDIQAATSVENLSASMYRLLCLMLYLPFHWLAKLFDWLAWLTYTPLYRENTRREAIRRAQRRSGDSNG